MYYTFVLIYLYLLTRKELVGYVYIIFHLFFQHVQTDPPTKEGLAQLVVQLIQYQENKLGKNATDPPFMRLPVSGEYSFTYNIYKTTSYLSILCVILIS